MIDLHTHTNASDGTFAPGELVRAALDAGLEALAVSDHDTFAGYDLAAPIARELGLPLVCAVEISTRLRRNGRSRGKSVHVLGYFLDGPPPGFRAWLETQQASRRDRNRRLAARLQSFGVNVTLEEVESLGRTIAGRPHFARIMRDKGFVATLQQAFDLYLGETAKAYVRRDEPSLVEGVRRVREAGGLASLAHPVRISRDLAVIEDVVARTRDAGLAALEVYHSDHTPAASAAYIALARRYDLALTGGTDFHGDHKPGLLLGSVSVPLSLLDNLRLLASPRA
jgi:predicted metal-dependent phosphoesterase TrpH